MTGKEFFDWWKSRLGELIPSSLSGSWHDAKTTIALDLENDQVRLSAPSIQQSALIRLSGEGGAEDEQAAQAFLSELGTEPQRIRVSVPPDQYLMRRLTLPRAAKSNLAETVGYQLPQLTPFGTDEVLYACGETQESPSEGPISAWLVALPRRSVDHALALIDQSPPDMPLPLKMPPAQGEPLVVSWAVSENPGQTRRPLRMAWVGLVVLWVAVLSLHFHNRQQLQTTFDQKQMELRQRAGEVARLREYIDDARIQAAWLADRRQTAVSPLLLLDALTRQLDDQTWLEGLELRDRSITLRGISSSPATLLQKLEASSLLQDVRFNAAITRDGRGQGDRFNISARLEDSTPGDDS